MRCFVMPVIVETTGNVIKELKKYLETIRGKHSIDSVQKKKNSCTRDIAHNKESVTI